MLIFFFKKKNNSVKLNPKAYWYGNDYEFDNKCKSSMVSL